MNHENTVLWIWLQLVFGAGSPLPWQIYDRFPGGLEEFYSLGPRGWRTMKFLTPKQMTKLCYKSLDEAKFSMEYGLKMGWQMLTPECEKYPHALRYIPDPPAVLYVKGWMPDLNGNPSIAVAGAREALPSSIQTACRVGYECAAWDAVLVTGGAVGVDSAAITGALQASGTVISVLPVDLSSSYLLKNMALRTRVLESGGALVTEYLNQDSPARGGFNLRNRLITGMCPAVVLIQAALRSGTMIYGRHAADQGRELFIAAGPESAVEYSGSRALLEDGARPFTKVQDILFEYEMREAMGTLLRKPEKGKKRRGRNPAEKTAAQNPAVLAPMLKDSGGEESAEASAVIAGLCEGEKLLDELVEKTGMDTGAMLRLLTQLEMQGRIECLPGNRYRLK